MILVAGEALVDLIPGPGGVLRPSLGGGPFNTAVALGRLEAPAGFLGRLSTDGFGRMLDDRLAEAGVDRRYVLRGGAPTPLAVVQQDAEGSAEYTFYLTGTAYADLAPDDLPILGPEVKALHLGTLALATNPPAGALEELMAREAGERLIVVDPNVRPGVAGDVNSYLRRFESWLAVAHVVKLSAADAAWLYPGQGPKGVLDLLIERGTGLALLTLGADGAIGQSRAGRGTSASPRVDVADTVGAGDAFNAGVLWWLWHAGRLDAGASAALGDMELDELLAFATIVAALQCSRAGASPPTLAEVRAF
ncbi:MAG TPA: carbohydrate kinase, partial [Miltoncostaeaceae bacterium]|nr:carbohydrate kinase [Miltoncostaeaceae bacterium]